MAIGDLRSKSPLLELPIINAHARSNVRVHQIAKLKTGNYSHSYGKITKISAIQKITNISPSGLVLKNVKLYSRH